ncbi:MAG: hypothetical protein HYR60_02960 [Acidobacteria bacterium]|nr:hypothetical protein [Acidobacteriota bacterium]MBI3474020.1 hypothetical protein [Candidatus Solibacter usitatus]
MTFPVLLLQAIQSSEIPLRFEPGAEEAVAAPVTGLIRSWLLLHQPDNPASDFDYGQKALLSRLLEELEGSSEIPA